ncbi:MAG: LacI family DNA-binding transcriptional regulator [Verrucomicrobiota bacterium]
MSSGKNGKPQQKKQKSKPCKYRQQFHGVPTIAHVAKAAGVGVGTVSRVVNNSHLVRLETRKIVEEAMLKVGYLPPAPQKRLRTNVRQKTPPMNAVAIILPENVGFQWISDFVPIYAYAVAGAETALRHHGISCIIHQLYPEGKMSRGNPIPKVDGCLVLAADRNTVIPSWINKKPCVMFMGASIGSIWCDRVTYNNVRCGELAAEHMADALVERAVVIVPASQSRQFGVFEQRAAAFLSFAGQQGIEGFSAPLEYPIDRPHSPDEVMMERVVKQIFSTSNPPQGIFVSADIMLPSLYRQLHKIGIQPGRDIKIVGCNNERPFLNVLESPPPVVDLHSKLIGERAVEHLIWRAKHPESSRASLLIEPTLHLS